MEAAKVLKDVETPQTIQFIFFGAEEAGLCGSAYHVKQMTQEQKDKVLVMMNYDSLVAGENAYVYGDINGNYRDRALAMLIFSNFTRHSFIQVLFCAVAIFDDLKNS